MNTPSFRNWQSVQTEVLRRIHARDWKPGDLIPNEADLALEFGCARTTVNRALRAVAESGLLDRRRKAGTRVAVQPVAKATLNIAVIRNEIEVRGQEYGSRLITRHEAVPPLALNEDFEAISANEWLLKHAPYTHGEIILAATSATQDDAAVLQCPAQSALFTIDRVTWDGGSPVTRVRLLFSPGHQIRTVL